MLKKHKTAHKKIAAITVVYNMPVENNIFFSFL